MWALRSVLPGQFELGEAPIPAPGPGQVLVRVLAGGICGSDLPKLWRLRADLALDLPWGYPLHEILGEVVAAPGGEHDVGSRVVGWALGSLGLAEYVVAEANDVVGFDAGIPATQAVVIQPLACALHAINRVDVAGQKVCVLGLGPFGLLLSHLAKVKGATTVVGIDPVRRTDPRSFGLDEVVTADSRRGLASLNAEGFVPDVVIEAVGHQTRTIDDAITAVGRGGTVLCCGIPDQPMYPIAFESVMRKNVSLVGAVTGDRRGSLRIAHRHLALYPDLPSSLVTDVLAPRHAEQAYALARSPIPGLRKIVLDYLI